MPVELPNLDDLTFDDLIAEALRLIPTYAPQWTNHNPSDPGITLLELFAHLTEMQLYRINCVPESHIRMFLKLLNGSEPYANENLNSVMIDTIRNVRKVDRAVSCNDYERLAKEADGRIARVMCLPKRDLRRSFERDAPGYVGMIVVPDKENANLLDDIIKIVDVYLDSRRLITTRIHVVGPQYVHLQISFKLILLPGFLEKEVYKSCKEVLTNLYNPYEWPFGRNVYISEIYAQLDQVAGVDAVEVVLISTKSETTPSIREMGVNESQQPVIELKSHELIGTVTFSKL